jgi:hypothetical protein
MIRVDCFGGKCTSDGYIIKNGEEIFEQSPHHSAHQILLKRIYPNYNSWFFIHSLELSFLIKEELMEK